MALTASIPAGVFIYQLNDPMNLYLTFVGPSLVGQTVYALLSSLLLCNKLCVLNFMTLGLFSPAVVTRFWLQQIKRVLFIYLP
jgi:hypothetical protein